MDPDPDLDPRIHASDPDADPDPAIFVVDLGRCQLKTNLKSFPAYSFLKVHLHKFLMVKSQKEVRKAVGIKVFLAIFAW